MKILEAIGGGFYIFAHLFPLWWILIMVICIKNGMKGWSSWLIASSFCLALTYFVTYTAGPNLGSYFIIIVGLWPSILAEKLNLSNELINLLNNEFMQFNILPSILLIIIPTFLLFTFRKKKLTDSQ
jgi:hypothetical protein